MKKHISAAFAVLALAACSKMAPENETVISELPEGENQQETVEPKGEGIVFQLPETKVILNGDTYQFEGTEEIVVKARSGAVTVMTNTTTKPNIFKGVFETSLGRERETFDFYFNCANKTTAEKELVQNGQPWLECIGVKANRVADDSKANYIIDESQKIELRELENRITLALVSTYDCTVDFHSLSAEIPATQDKKTIAGMSVTAGKPYFVNINTDTDGEFKGGFYLAVKITGETGTMYTSYGTATAISKNTPIQIKKKFTPLSGTVSFDGFKTTYDIAKTDLATANSKNSNFMTSGTITVTLSGISSKLDFVESVTFFDGDTEFTLKDKSKSGNTYTFNVGESYTHNDFGPRTLTAKVNFKSPVSSSTNINGETIR
ncbi:MAG: lipoprotein, partial [Candidatus Cryptobacteroides sp.]|nr:lipoprotein [Candidatus Cryptobacteroides sp.]